MVLVWFWNGLEIVRWFGDGWRWFGLVWDGLGLVWGTFGRFLGPLGGTIIIHRNDY